MKKPLLQMDKTAFDTVGLHDASDERAYWLSRTPEERFQALEFLRQQQHGYKSTDRIQRFFEIVERKRD